MPTVSAVVVNTKGIEETLRDLRQDQVPYAMQLALNDLAFDTVRIERLEAQQVFKRPTPWFLRSIQVAKRATKRDHTAAVWIGETVADKFGKSRYEAVEGAQTAIARPHIYGGPRSPTATERRLRGIGVLRNGEWLIPAVSAKKNVYGNVAAGEYEAMLSYFRAFRVSGYDANRAWNKGTSRRGVRYYIVPWVSGRMIFRVKGKGQPRPVWYITKNSPTYRKRFDFYGEADRHAKKFGGYFASKAMKRALATAR